MGEPITNKAVRKATGKDWGQWFEELEASPAKDHGNKALTTWLTENHTDIGGWWCQVITEHWEAERTQTAVRERTA